MKKLFLIGCTIFLFCCHPQEKPVHKPKFLIGHWKRLNDKPEHQTYETWNTNFTGFGYTKKGNNTTFSEQMRILNKKDTLYLEVTGVNEQPTLFRFTAQTDTSFVCENLQNEFPKTIHYFIENQQLNAVVSNDDFRIDFVFDKIHK